MIDFGSAALAYLSFLFHSRRGGERGGGTIDGDDGLWTGKPCCTFKGEPLLIFDRLGLDLFCVFLGKAFGLVFEQIERLF
jgi:hypothetical protein